ncbi:prepilin-type N-terminal cleavage/methylation domain-containing protein [Acinetobacter wanghuae]|uniref:Prepilin-type N-terminal cleavage/methylation domain-containing protein n=1 Tax=Acinetobacter wanghuae TaxID=2662362 RepID=A0A5Q0P0Z3_9GAMM|nr:type II secretion system protein [Acinetobacter wanghuae]MQW93168.1 prepilin-type N-terminal cleavage/methylation domain-containing protein [Acinetobacter wanghuae]QGA10406.1 prepilin-type N-terminal cleavage/methylation domain-containing protein [Acinetobacter wanghuae]
MKQPLSLFAKQRGVTLVESLISLLLFSIIVLGSGAAIKSMITTQKDMNIGFIIVNEMQNRLQAAQTQTSVANLCSRISTATKSIGNTTYYFKCFTQRMSTDWTVEMPILVASQKADVLDSCITNGPDPSCYVVGR